MAVLNHGGLILKCVKYKHNGTFKAREIPVPLKEYYYGLLRSNSITFVYFFSYRSDRNEILQLSRRLNCVCKMLMLSGFAFHSDDDLHLIKNLIEISIVGWGPDWIWLNIIDECRNLDKGTEVPQNWLTHCSKTTQYCDMDLGQHWLE